MTKYFICSILSLAMVLGNTQTASAGKLTATSATVSDLNHSEGSKAPAQASTETPLRNAPGAAPHSPAEKGHGHVPAMDETPHIHHYHKNRVRKLKRHHGKCWFMAQFLVVACNLVLLLIAYLHAAH